MQYSFSCVCFLPSALVFFFFLKKDLFIFLCTDRLSNVNQECTFCTKCIWERNVQAGILMLYIVHLFEPFFAYLILYKLI